MGPQQTKTREVKVEDGSRVFVAPDRIILATDLADLDYLIPHAIAQCRACESSLTIVHVIPEKSSGSLDETVALIAETAIKRSWPRRRKQYAPPASIAIR
jgi:hypothetical protein